MVSGAMLGLYEGRSHEHNLLFDGLLSNAPVCVAIKELENDGIILIHLLKSAALHRDFLYLYV